MIDIEIVTTRLAECERVIERGLNTFVEVGAALLEIRDGRLYRERGYSTFEEYCREKWNLSKPYATQMIQASQVVGNLVAIATVLPSNEAQVRPLTSLPPETQTQVWQQVVDTAPKGKITGAFVQEVVERVTRPENIHVSDDSYEWYTPADYIEAARAVMGSIDLDPASCIEANEIVKADAFYSQADDGLSHEWFGRVWLNPPYNMPNVENFTYMAHTLYESKIIDQAIILVNNSTDAGWFHVLLKKYPVCFTRGRVKYWGPHSSQARQGQAVFYLGKNKTKFKRIFSEFGVVVGML